jgi:hypothetical protein
MRLPSRAEQLRRAPLVTSRDTAYVREYARPRIASSFKHPMYCVTLLFSSGHGNMQAFHRSIYGILRYPSAPI